MKYKTVKKLWLAAAILTTTTSLWTNVNAMETPAASGAGVIRALNEQRILSEQYALQQIQTGAGELAEGEAAGEAEINDVAELSLGNAEEEMPAADQPELAVAIAPNYVNIRKEPSTEGEVLGKLYRNTVGVIEAAEEGWYYITSGSVSGYVSAEYVCVGEEARALAEEIGTQLARVTTTTLKVRTEASTEAAVLGLVPGGDILTVTETLDGWLKVDAEEGEGYVAADYVETYTEYPHAESVQEEAERLAREEAARRAAQEAEARRKAAEQQAAAQKKAAAQMSEVPDFDKMDERTLSMNRLAAGIVMTCKGMPFFQAGEEFARTKHGEGNSFKSSWQLNKIDWTRALEQEELVDYYRGLLALRRKFQAYGTCEPDCKKTFFRENQIAGYELEYPNGRAVCVFYNPWEKEALQKLPEGNWKLLCDGKRCAEDGAEMKESMMLPAKSMVLLARE